ncbi:ATP phosphoribosyltransferase regulatory subunit protein [Minicystis rosea]|nr:ATP phosphoribosyltransferase regulatory subunit protein [Minicystis rosea]
MTKPADSQSAFPTLGPEAVHHASERAREAPSLTSASPIESAPRALSHPLPAGLRDLLPEETRRRRALGREVLDHFDLHGYRLVTPPAFELAEVLERGLGALDPSDVLRFIEPESGEVAALRPDMTPQIARMVATRLGREPQPIRLCYEGTIVRRRQGRARRHRQVPQAGVELYGTVPGASPSEPATLAGDLEILRLAASVADRLGLAEAAIDLGHASIARSLIESVPRSLAAEVGDALGQKDGARVERLLAGRPNASTLARLGDLHGGGPGEISAEALFAQAAPLLEGSESAAKALRELQALWTAARDSLGTVLRLDLGEVRGFAYYTGMIFHLLAPGPGEPIGAGGRYDDLLARFDAPMPAVGFALYLDAVAWARESAGSSEVMRRSAVVAVDDAAESAALLAALRSRGVPAVACPVDSAFAYATAWRYTHVVTASGEPRHFRAQIVGPQTIEAADRTPDGLAAALAQR